jgi:hypothetical protein
MHRVARWLVVVGSVLLSSVASGQEACRTPLPDPALAVPPGNALALQLEAVGVQVYTCAATPSGAAWTFTAPEADLTRAGAAAGKHAAGPTWRALDGSEVVGAKVAAATPDPGAVPWLLLRAASHAGPGSMAPVTFIQRVATHGGLAPTGGCGAATVGAIARVPYTATYCFYRGEAASPMK